MMKALAILLLISLAGCGGPLGILTGGGPNVAANVQAGKENVQQAVLKQDRIEAGRDVVQQTSPVTAGTIEKVNVQQTPIWMILLLILGWLLPSPNEIVMSIRGIFKK